MFSNKITESKQLTQPSEDVVRALSITCDTRALAVLERLLGPATVVVENGGGEPSFCLHYRLKKPVGSKEERAKLEVAHELAARITGITNTHPNPKPRRIISENPGAEIYINTALQALWNAAGNGGGSQARVSEEPSPSSQTVTLTEALTLRLRLLENGFEPVVVSGKAAVVQEWPRLETTAESLREWTYDRRNVFATNTGSRAKNAPALDIDITHQEAAEAVEALARQHFAGRGDIYVRIGLPPKRLIPLRTDAPFRKLKREFVAPVGVDGKPPKIEILGDGQQYVVAGIHPDTRKPYRWTNGVGDTDVCDIRRDSLPLVTVEDCEAFLADAAKLLVEQFGFVEKQAKASGGDGGGKAKARADDAPRTDEELHQLLEATRIEGEWHNNMLVVTASLIGRGYPDSRIKLICAPYFNDGFTDQDFDDLLDGARKKWGKPNDEAEAATHINDELARLAGLSTLDYERQRRDAADKLNLRQSVLDDLVGEVGSNSNNRLPKFAEVAEQLLRDIDFRGEELCAVVNENGFEHLWLYRDGLWLLLLEPDSWLNHQIELTVRAMKLSKKADAKFITEARKYIERSPNVRTQKRVVWDNHGMIPTLSGLVDPVTLAVRPLRKEDYATWRIDLEFDPSATCPLWQELLDDYFIEHNSDDARNLLQEFSGTTLVDRLPKALRRALVAVGPSNVGKSTLLNVLAGVLTTAAPISTAIGDLSRAHGLQEFTQRRPWVLHEAFNVGEWHVSDRTKQIISGDPVSVNPKNIKALTMSVHAPPIWGSNHPPTFKENTDAIVNRLLILTLKRVFDEHAPPIGVAAKARAVNPTWEPADLILAQERPGLLIWALTGLQRLLKQGQFTTTLEGEAAIEDMRRDANPVGAFVRDCITYDPARMMLTVDFHAAFTGWRKETHGDDKIHFTPQFIGKNLAALADPRIVQDKNTFKEEDGRRYYLGITLNQEGRGHFEAQRQSTAYASLGYDPQFRRMSATAEETNRPIPGKWLDDPRVQKLVWG